MTVPLPPGARVLVLDTVRLGTVGIRTRPMRTAFAALGIAIGIAALVAVIGIPASNQAAVRAALAALGPNLLTVAAGQNLLTGETAPLPPTALEMIRRLGPVTAVSAIGRTPATVRRSDLVPSNETRGLAVYAARQDLLEVLNATVAAGSFLNPATAEYPVVVLGAKAAQLLGVSPGTARAPSQVWIGDRWFTVVGTLGPLPLTPQIDNSVLVGWSAAQRYLGFDGSPEQIFVRVENEAVDDVRAVLGRTVNPERPEEVLVSKPSDALAAQRLVEQAYSSLFLGLGAVALLVGGIGVANTMVISVLERRREIGLRRALGATRRHILVQFLAESVLVTGIGTGVGILLGIAVTGSYALYEGWPATLPPLALVGGLGVAVVIGLLAGVYPATRAARLAPTEALATR